MLRFVFAFVFVIAAGTAAQAQQPAPQQSGAAPPAATGDGGFANEMEKGSYALGYSYGQMLQGRKIEVLPEPLIAGLRDALAGGRGRMSEQEVTEVARSIQNEAARRMQKERAALAVKNRAEGTAFLVTNMARSGVVALPSGLQYEVLRPGDGPKPAVDDNVKVQFQGTLLDGTVFDSSYERGQPIVVRPNQVIKGWTEALPIMSVGAKWKLFVPPDLAYGDQAAAANIPPGSTLIFEVELLSIEPKTAGGQSPGWGR